MAKITIEQKHTMRRDVLKYKNSRKKDQSQQPTSYMKFKCTDFKAVYLPSKSKIIRDEKDCN